MSGAPRRTQEEHPREWSANGRMKRVGLHMKPDNRADTVGARIRFKWSPDTGKARVGRVGPHWRAVSPETQ